MGEKIEEVTLQFFFFLTLWKMSCPLLQTLRGHFTSRLHIINHVHLFTYLPFFMVSFGLGPNESGGKDTALIAN